MVFCSVFITRPSLAVCSLLLAFCRGQVKGPAAQTLIMLSNIGGPPDPKIMSHAIDIQGVSQPPSEGALGAGATSPHSPPFLFQLGCPLCCFLFYPKVLFFDQAKEICCFLGWHCVVFSPYTFAGKTFVYELFKKSALDMD